MKGASAVRQWYETSPTAFREMDGGHSWDIREQFDHATIWEALCSLGLPGPWLDLGCGRGWLQHKAWELDPEWARQGVGADLAWPALLQLRLHLPEARLVQCDAESLPFKSGSFSLLVSVGLLEFYRLEDMLPHWKALLRPPGNLILTAHNAWMHKPLLGLRRRLGRPLALQHLKRFESPRSAQLRNRTELPLELRGIKLAPLFALAIACRYLPMRQRVASLRFLGSWDRRLGRCPLHFLGWTQLLLLGPGFGRHHLPFAARWRILKKARRLAPRFWLRSMAAIELLGPAPKRFLEVGCGAGESLRIWEALGWKGCAVEPSQEARKEALATIGGRTPVLESLDLVEGSYPLLLAFEVLEHLEDDKGDLRHWLHHLDESGLVLLSVPAHRRSWSRHDSLAGHFRRYDRSDLEALLKSSGLETLKLITYGFPLTWLTHWLRDLLAPSDGRSQLSRVEKTARSGLGRRLALLKVLNLPARLFCAGPAHALQRLFFSRTWGEGWLVLARRQRRKGA